MAIKKTFQKIIRLVGLFFLFSVFLFSFFREKKEHFKGISKMIPFSSQAKVLHIVLDQNLKGSKSYHGIDFGKKNSPLYIDDLIEVIEAATLDPAIKGLLLEFSNPLLSIKDMDRLVGAMENFRASNKRIICYTEEWCKKKEFFIGVHSDYHMVAPTTIFSLEGFFLAKNFYKGAFDRVGIREDGVSAGRYKDGLDPFCGKKMRPHVKKKYAELFDELWAHMLDTMAKKRGIDRSLLVDMSQKLLIPLADVQAARLIDGVGYRSDLYKEIRGDQNTNPTLNVEKEEDILIPYRTYCKKITPKRSWGEGPRLKVGIIYLEGTIVAGPTPKGLPLMDAQRTEKALKKAAEKYDLLIIRLNTPGGSISASDKLRNTIEKLARLLWSLTPLQQRQAFG